MSGIGRFGYFVYLKTRAEELTIFFRSESNRYPKNTSITTEPENFKDMKTEKLLLFFVFCLFATGPGMAQLVNVVGKVTNQEGQKINNVSILEKVSGIGTISSEDGLFSLLLKPGEVLLNFSLPGYQSCTTEFILKKDTVLNISLPILRAEKNKRLKREHSQEGELSEHLPDTTHKME